MIAQDFMTEIVINGNTSHLNNLLTVDQINNFSISELRILRNTIFARYGYKFTSYDLANHFLQFPWYEGTKTSVENELTLIDWKNIELIKILEKYYPTKIDLILNLKQNGIYIFDNNHNLIPIYTNNTNEYWKASFYSYTELNGFLFFWGLQGKALLFDYITNYYFEIEDYISGIISIYYQSKNILIINASTYYQTQNSFTLNLPDGIIRDEMIGTTVNIEEAVYTSKIIYDGETLLGGDYNQEPVHFFTVLDKNIVAILENSHPFYLDGINVYKNETEHLALKVAYNTTYDVYFILPRNHGYRLTH
jgi:hypothetical protein